MIMGIMAGLRQQLLDTLVNKDTFTPPTTQYYGLHAGTHVTTQANSGQDQLECQHLIPDGTAIVIDPAGVAEAATVSSSSGTGPYTHTLSGNLSNTHAVDTEVEFAPDPDSGNGFAEPVDANYARQQETLATLWAAASGSDPSSQITANDVDFGLADAAYKSGITHVGEFAAASGGFPRRTFAVSKITPGAGDGLSIPAGQLVFELGNVDDTYSE